MEESKAYDAELTYRQSQRDTSKITYVLVSIKKIKCVLKDVMIDGSSIREIVKSNQKEIKNKNVWVLDFKDFFQAKGYNGEL